MNFWTYIYYPAVLLLSLIGAALFCLCVYVKLAVLAILWVLRRLFR